MRPDIRDAAYLWDMLIHAREATGFVQGMSYARFVEHRLTIRAVERCIEIVGEAARSVSPEFEAAHPEVPWRKIVAMRHVLAHEYGEIRTEVLWRIVTVHLPVLVAQLEPLTPPGP